MRNVAALAWKEMFHIYLSPIAYAFLVFIVGFVTFMFFRAFFLVGQVTMSEFFTWFPWAFILLVPAVTMRMWAEERKQGTIEFLLTSPVETWQIVAAKFLGGLSLIVVGVLATLYAPFSVASYGNLDVGPVIGGYLGVVLLGGSFIAIAMFLSSFTRDQIVAFLVSAFVLFGLVLIGHPFINSEFGPGSWVGAVARAVSPTTRFESIGRGVIDVRDLYYFAGTTLFFLYLNARVIDLRRWR